MTNTEIATLLCSYRAAKNAAKDLRTEMMRVVTEQLGLDQDEARQTSLETMTWAELRAKWPEWLAEHENEEA